MSFNTMYQPMGMPGYPTPQGMNWYGQTDPMRQQFPAPGQAPGPTMQDNGMIWVQGEAGAKAYMVAPGNSVVLWDSEANVIYIKSADPSGMPCMRIFDYNERTTAQRTAPPAGNTRYVTWEEFNQFASKFEQNGEGSSNAE